MVSSPTIHFHTTINSYHFLYHQTLFSYHCRTLLHLVFSTHRRASTLTEFAFPTIMVGHNNDHVMTPLASKHPTSSFPLHLIQCLHITHLDFPNPYLPPLFFRKKKLLKPSSTSSYSYSHFIPQFNKWFLTYILQFLDIYNFLRFPFNDFKQLLNKVLLIIKLFNTTYICMLIESI